MSFSVASQNVLADSYIKPEYFPHTAPVQLDPKWRWPALVAHLAGLGVDLICLQEVERPVFEALSDRLVPLGYGAELALKDGGKPDGCATFWRRSVLGHRGTERIVYSDGTGHVALLLDLEQDGRPFTVANTHIKWQPPETPPEASHALVQTSELLERIDHDPERRTWVACGDFNSTPESEVIRRMVARGLIDPFAPDAYTANANGRRKKIDYIFTTGELSARARPLPSIEDDTPLPSPSQPSDHLAIVADLEWV